VGVRHHVEDAAVTWARAAVVIPWRDAGDLHRQANLSAVLDHLASLELPIILADDGRKDGEPFNRSAAYNHGIRLAHEHHDADVYVFHEADMIVPYDQIEDGIRVAEHTPGLVVPFDRYRYLGQEATRLALSGMNVESLYPDRIMEGGTAVGAVGIASVNTMDAVGRWDEAFAGHGYDDRAMYHAFRVACGRATIIVGDATHLWHPMAYAPWERVTAAADAANYSEADVRATVNNRHRMRRYLAAQTPEDVRALTTGGAA
jgi:hypothetical protein